MKYNSFGPIICDSCSRKDIMKMALSLKKIHKNRETT